MEHLSRNKGSHRTIASALAWASIKILGSRHDHSSPGAVRGFAKVGDSGSILQKKAVIVNIAWASTVVSKPIQRPRELFQPDHEYTDVLQSEL